MFRARTVLAILIFYFVVSYESFRYVHLQSTSRWATVAVAVVPTTEIPGSKQEIIINPVKSDAEKLTSDAALKGRGFGKPALVQSSEEEGSEKGKRSEAKKLYQRQRKIDKGSSSLANMIGSSPKDSGKNFKNSDYV